jgi:NhaP-type Na+/H+ or K+/H+ antiporter
MWCKDESVKSKLSPCALGLAFGVIKGVCLLALAWAGWLWGYESPMMERAVDFYYGYAPTFVGGLFGAVWGFICGFVFGIILGSVYNFFLCCCKKSCSSSESK